MSPYMSTLCQPKVIWLLKLLTGPFEIETAEPGDVLVVDIQDVQPLEDRPWGFTGIFAKKNGGEKDGPSSFAHPCY